MFRLNDVLMNGANGNVLAGTCRVLGIVEALDELWLINRPGLKKAAGKENQIDNYIRKAFSVSLSKYMEYLSEGGICKLNMVDVNFLSDHDRIVAATSSRERRSVELRIGIRDRRFEIIRKIVCEADGTLFRQVVEVIKDPSLSKAIAEQAVASNVSVRHVYKILHQFWAGGSYKNTLLSGYERCGNPGKEKPQRCHLGRKSVAFHKGLVSSDGYVVSDDCKRKLAYGFALINQGHSKTDAYWMTMAAHWATHSEEKLTRRIIPTLFEPVRRPTPEQFEYWGKKRGGKSISELILGPTKHRQRATSRGGSEQDLVLAVGQMSGFDGTSTDVYLTRTNSRLKRLPPMTRTIIKDIRTGVIYGIYCGWEGASPATALKAILHGANPNKDAWAARFGVQLPADAMPAMLARQHLADNGELKAAESTEAEQQFGFGVMFTPTMQGDRKGGVESQHKSDHANLDHKLPGTTRGKRRERGDVAPVVDALWNYYEYMRELIHWIIEHNTRILVPELAPDAMLLESPPIAPTRMNIFKWLTDHGMNNSLPVDYESMRAFCLPYVDAVIRKNGVYLELEINGRKKLIPRLRFSSDELVATGILSEVKRTMKPVHTRVKIDDSDPFMAWLPTRTGLIPMHTCSSDRIFQQKLTLTELVALIEDMDLSVEVSKSSDDQYQLDKFMRRTHTTSDAMQEARDEINKLGHAVSAAELRRDLRSNRQEEMAFLRDREGPHVGDLMPELAISMPEMNHADLAASTPLSLAEMLMEAHNRKGGGHGTA